MMNKVSLFRQGGLLLLVSLLLLSLSGCQKKSMLDTFLTPTLEEEPEYYIYREEELEFQFVEAELTESVNGMYALTITIEITNPTDHYIAIGHGYSVEYEYEGEWHFLYSPDMFQMSSIALESGATIRDYVSVPVYILSGTNNYRLYFPNGGTCPIPREFD